MLPKLSSRSILEKSETSFGDEYGEIGLLLREPKRSEADDLEKELNIYRSGSAPPTIEGSLTAVGGLFNHGSAGGFAGVTSAYSELNVNGFSSEEELRSDPAYSSYYYANVNLNPRLPPPLMSREDWRYTQRLQGGSSAIGDRRKTNKTMPPGFNSKKQENENGNERVRVSEWGGDGLIGLQGLGLGGKQKSLVEIFQEDLTRATPVSGHPSRPASRTAFDENPGGVGPEEPELARLHHELSSLDSAYNVHNSSSASYSYAAALGASLSRSSTPDPQRVARAPSLCPTPIGGNRTVNTEKRSINSPTSFNAVPSHLNESVDLVAALSSMDLSNGTKKHEIAQIHSNSVGGISKPRNNSLHVELHKKSGFPSNNSSHHHLDSPSSPFLTHGRGGYPMSPVSNLPPLFENAAAAAMAVPGFDARMLGASHFGAAATQEHNLGRMGNQFSGNSVQAAYVDPLYLQYHAQIAALNDPSADRSYMGNSYADMFQKAYVGNVFSPQKSNFGAPSMSGKLGSSSPHGYYANPAFGLGFSYPGSPLANPVIPSSPGSPVRHGDFNLRVHGSGMRSVVGPWHLGNVDGGFALSLLEEFKSNKTKSFELLEIAGHVVDFSADQYGSRFIQQKLETATAEEKNMVFEEIFPQALTLMTDVFGNYVIQKFFEHGMPSQRRKLADELIGHVLSLSLQMYGCRVIQKAIEVVDVDQKIEMVKELDGHVIRCVRDQNGNHVIQKCIECVPEENVDFIVSTFFGNVVTLSTHPYGCRVIQRVLEHCKDERTQSKVMEEVLTSVSMLAQDQYGNYVVQHVLEHGKAHERSTIIQELAGKIVQMSQQKFASNVVEKCLTFGDPSERLLLVNEMLGTTDENEPLQAMMKDQFANYVVQKVLETCSDQQRELILSRIKVHLNALKKYTYGKHIVARVEKLVAAGERRIAAQSSNLA